MRLPPADARRDRGRMDDFSVVSALIGAALAVGGAMFLDWWRERKTADRARTMVSVEIDGNVALLKDYWINLNRIEMDLPAGYPPAMPINPLYYATRLTRLPPPPWRHVMWESQLSALPIALDGEQIKQCHAHHSGVDTIATIRATLVEVWEQQEAEYRSSPEDSE